MKATTTWTKGMSSIITNNRGHEITIDLPDGKGGENLGATAFEVCLMSYSGCVNTIFNVVAKKMRIEFTSLEVDTTAQQQNGAPTFTDVEVELRIDSEANDEKIKKCLEQTLKMCPVGVLFHQAGVNTTYKIVKMQKA
ncbi:OsmC family peroxiredoxin [Marinifilum sp. N1E240]|uniref:OsmC family protein n=1 Tax=Marinifilum sp. N1E240 TaxID=2608082 RepID=UPI00128E7707|nr:OsmC family protein [Marinifilum sp. N1E240]MPQ47799.1 OsmC family peroxiredoxin [Marinifilum sp. N1E240]